MATKTKTLAAMVDEGETVWLRVKMSDFARMQTLSEALDSALSEQASDLVYLYVEKDARVSMGSDDVELVLTVGGDGVFGELVKARGDGQGNFETVDIGLDLGLEEVRCLVG